MSCGLLGECFFKHRVLSPLSSGCQVSISLVIESLHWLPVKGRVTFKVLWIRHYSHCKLNLFLLKHLTRTSHLELDNLILVYHP